MRMICTNECVRSAMRCTGVLVAMLLYKLYKQEYLVADDTRTLFCHMGLILCFGTHEV